LQHSLLDRFLGIEQRLEVFSFFASVLLPDSPTCAMPNSQSAEYEPIGTEAEKQVKFEESERRLVEV
jgi:hypothetical protein